MSESNVPTETVSALADLNPKQAHAVRLYTTRGSGAFGNQSKAASLAGFNRKYGHVLFQRDDVRAAIKEIREAKLRAASDVIDDIKALSPDAKDEIQSQLESGRALEIIDPREIFGEKLEKLQGEDDQSRLKEINKHNRVIAHLMRERREAAKLILAYDLGTPEQRIRHTRAADRSDLEKELDKLTKEEFQELGEFIFGKDDEDEGEDTGAGGEPTPVLEAEIID